VVHIGRRPLKRIRRAVRKLTEPAAGDDALEKPALCSTENMFQQLARSALMQTVPQVNRGPGRHLVDRRELIQGVEDDLASTSDRVVCARELAAAAHVSERTLHRAFHDWFGVSPARLAKLRKFHSVRDALLAANPMYTSVTDVLVQHEINQFGRFAGAYRSLFGELPSQTLYRGSRHAGTKGIACRT
jgi:AraC family ethanolamine operon transcriptional activator